MFKNYFIKPISALVLGGTLMYSCLKKEDVAEITTPTTLQQDKENIKASFDNLYSCLQKANDGGFSNFIYSSVVDPKLTNKEWIGDVLDKWYQQYSNKTNNNNSFDFTNLNISPANKGVYEWNTTKSIWEKKSVSDIVVLKFPANSTSTALSNELSLDKYELQDVWFKNQSQKLPSSISVSLKQNNVVVSSININNIVFDKTSKNFSMPLNADIELYTAPFTNKITWRKNTPQEFVLNYDLSSVSACNSTLTAKVKVKHAQYDNYTAFSDVEKISGLFSHNDIKIEYDLDVVKLAALNNKLEDIKTSQINACLSTNVLYKGSKMGSLELLENPAGATIINIVYKDGSKENAEKYFNGFNDKIKEIFKKFN